MNLDAFAIALLLLFLPGLLCAVVVSKLTTHRDRKPLDFLIPSLAYGFLIFVVYQELAQLAGNWLALPDYNIVPDSRSLERVAPRAILIASAIGFLLALLVSTALNQKWLHRFARRIGVTRKFGDRDVWSYIMNSNDVEWLVVRDFEKKIYYVGTVLAFSDEEDTRELVLNSTLVYDNVSGKLLYAAGTVYLSFVKDKIALEIPDVEIPSSEGRHEN